MGGGITNIHENIVLPLQAATTVVIAAAIIGFPRDSTSNAAAANRWAKSPPLSLIYTLKLTLSSRNAANLYIPHISIIQC